MDYILKLPLDKALKLIEKAQEEETKDYYYRWWLVRYPLYDKNNYESFNDFYEKYKPQKIVYDMRSKDELMNEILNTNQGKEGINK